jgi:preprotein translocase SecE subunit
MPKTAPSVPGGSAFRGSSLSQLLKDVWNETRYKTTWPTRPELTRSTTVVLAAIIAVSIYLAVWDWALALIVARLYGS